EMAVSPKLPRVRGCRAAPLPHRPVVGAAGRMRFNFIRRPPQDIDMTTVSFPSRNTGREMFVGVSDAPVMLFLERILRRIGIWIAVPPKSLNKLIAFLIGPEL